MEKLQNLSYILQFIDNPRFMTSSLSNLANSLSEGIDKIKCTYRYDSKNVKNAELNTKIAGAFLNTQTLKLI